MGAMDALCKVANANIHLDDTLINGLDDTLRRVRRSAGSTTSARLSRCPVPSPASAPPAAPVSSLFRFAVYNDFTNLCCTCLAAPPRQPILPAARRCSVGAMDALCKAVNANIHLDDTLSLGDLGDGFFLCAVATVKETAVGIDLGASFLCGRVEERWR